MKYLLITAIMFAGSVLANKNKFEYYSDYNVGMIESVEFNDINFMIAAYSNTCEIFYRFAEDSSDSVANDEAFSITVTLRIDNNAPRTGTVNVESEDGYKHISYKPHAGVHKELQRGLKVRLKLDNGETPKYPSFNLRGYTKVANKIIKQCKKSNNNESYFDTTETNSKYFL